MADRSAKRGTIWAAVVFAVWLLEWVTGLSGKLGWFGLGIDLMWFALLGWYVIGSRRWRLPRAVHTWGWMAVVAAISVGRAWWFGTSNEVFEIIQHALDGLPLEMRTGVRPKDLAFSDAVLGVLMIGIVVGIGGCIEALVVGVLSWIGDRTRAGHTPARVGLLPRIAVVLLQTPIFMVMMAIGLATIGGAVSASIHVVPKMPELSSSDLWRVAGIGLAAWALATIHLDRLLALASGGFATRLVLATFGIAAAAVLGIAAFHDGSVQGVVGAAVWLVAQLAAVRWAHPTATASPKPPIARV